MTIQPHQLLYLAPEEAVRAALALDPIPWDVLDRALRFAVVRHLLYSEGDLTTLELAIGDAALQASAREVSPWGIHWRYLGELLADGAALPSLTGDLIALEPDGRLIQILWSIQQLGPPVERERVRERTALSQANLSNLLGQLEERGLIERDKAGRSVYLLLTPRAMRVLKLHPRLTVDDTRAGAANRVEPALAAGPLAPRAQFWASAQGQT